MDTVTTSNTADSNSSEMHADATPRKKGRLHFLDWLRCLMVMSVVYAHLLRSGGITGGLDQEWIVDRPYHPLGTEAPGSNENVKISGLGVRWLSIARPWAIPALFWVSGGAVACSFKGESLPRISRLLIFTGVGMVFNLVLWLLSPADPACGPGNVGDELCHRKGWVFDFSVVDHSGIVFPIVFQMWYTLALMLFMVIQWPLITALGATSSAVSRLKLGLVQWICSSSLLLLGIFVVGAECPRPFLAAILAVVCEAAFIALALALVSSCNGQDGGEEFLPLKHSPSSRSPPPSSSTRTRALHYALGAVVVCQFGAVPFSESVTSITPGFALYVVTGFSKFFMLGFIMVRPRVGTRKTAPAAHWPDAKPLLSRVWPLAIFVAVICAPSTNWKLAGNLTFPYFTAVMDRVLYVCGGVVVVFILDRCSRQMTCAPLPAWLNYASLILYLSHPVLMTIMIAAGMRSAGAMWMLGTGLIVGGAYVKHALAPRKSR